MTGVLRVLAYGLIAAASPLALAATIAVLKTHQARLNGFIFATTFLLGESIVLVVVITLGSAAAPGKGGSSTVAASFELLLGALLLLAARRTSRRPAGESSPTDGRTGGRTQAVFERLAKITPKTALGAGLLLGIGGPKRLTIGIVAATTIAAADLTTGEEVAQAALYVAVAGILVWGPVAVFIVMGDRSRAWLSEAEKWLMARQRTVAIALLLAFGALLMSDALLRLF
jgi:hypothetical protein